MYCNILRWFLLKILHLCFWWFESRCIQSIRQSWRGSFIFQRLYRGGVIHFLPSVVSIWSTSPPVVCCHCLMTLNWLMCIFTSIFNGMYPAPFLSVHAVHLSWIMSPDNVTPEIYYNSVTVQCKCKEHDLFAGICFSVSATFSSWG